MDVEYLQRRERDVERNERRGPRWRGTLSVRWIVCARRQRGGEEQHADERGAATDHDGGHGNLSGAPHFAGGRPPTPHSRPMPESRTEIAGFSRGAGKTLELCGIPIAFRAA